MHTVVRHLLARKNKRVPIRDKRKIALVLPGGLMTGVRGAGALVAFSELGLDDAFDAIYVISAGLPNASYFLSKQPRLGTSIYYEDLVAKEFINIFRPWKIVNIDYSTNIFKKIKPLNIGQVLSHPTKLHVRLIDKKSKKVTYLKARDVPGNEFMGLIRAATSIPYFHPGSTKIQKNHYKDPGFRKNQLLEHIQYVLDSDATDIVIVYNHLGQRRSVKKALKLPKDRVLEIAPNPKWFLSRFEKDKEKLRKEALQTGRLVKKIFGKNSGIKLDKKYDRN